ncbi:tRNA uridine-5-carboxymethylaminomethyl(34) synthesis GTPase MnmE [Acetivibrio thermocellus]|uniref:tRNA uridine-5-carboxymethylaminomethyl(34) synthesis GTPase MnmE n=1 Tax=Acetivibrio thermocellus TaxID=1515 RepID=UPI0010A63155|nr:tRNA uridine-5-carboxymethylaminomethyl(34) synthesis GTPase MnmE [Acetivibrio thermocellus]THJ79557.1 tRNA uridine-5-carboxymethylaminomethyl(34) synthesis GTPase MnmE [Acetivibrio thermocellus]
MYKEDTIAAISTPHGAGGVGIIRISGDKAFEIAERIFRGKKDFKLIRSHTINYGKIVNPESGAVLDEVLLSKMEKPKTFTREDVVEINCHGGMVVLKNILELCIKEGARLAEPGEFTKRAFLNGRIDLSQAEAVIDLINSKTNESSKAAISQLEGKLSRKIKDARSKLIELLAHIEVTVDYPEHDIEEITGNMVYEEIGKIKEKLCDIVKSFERGRIIREGIDAVIIGKPNVGKSSLLNELSGKSKAIVTDIPGTTRDIIEEYININGIPLRIIDTAGIRETEDVVEKIGVEKTHRAIDEADLVIMMIDAKRGMDEDDNRILTMLGDKKLIILINKIDLVDEKQINEIESLLKGRKCIRTSVKEGTGISELENAITELFVQGEVSVNEEILLTNIRHKNLIDMAISSIEKAMESIDGSMPLDLVSIDITDAADYLGQITGESVSEDVMHEIFSKFCLGK